MSTVTTQQQQSSGQKPPMPKSPPPQHSVGNPTAALIGANRPPAPNHPPRLTRPGNSAPQQQPTPRMPPSSKPPQRRLNSPASGATQSSTQPQPVAPQQQPAPRVPPSSKPPQRRLNSPASGATQSGTQPQQQPVAPQPQSTAPQQPVAPQQQSVAPPQQPVAPQPQSTAPQQQTGSAPPPSGPQLKKDATLDEINSYEHALIDEVERGLIGVYGEDNWRHSKASALKKKPDQIIDVLNDGWKDVRPRDRRKKLDDITKKADERRDRLRDHYYFMQRGEEAKNLSASGTTVPSDLEKAYIAYYDEYNKSQSKGSTTSKSRDDAKKAMEKLNTKKDNFYKQAVAESEAENERQKIRKFIERAKLEHDVDLTSSTLKELEKELKQKLEAKGKDSRLGLLDQEKAKLTGLLGEHFTKAYDQLLLGTSKSANQLSYKEHRKILHEARDIGAKNKQIHDQHETRMKIKEYKDIFDEKTKNTAADKLYDFIIINYDAISKEAASMREKGFAAGDEKLKEFIDRMKKNKALTPEEKEDKAHSELDQFEEEQAKKPRLGIPYEKIGSTRNGQKITSAQRIALIKEQLALLKKHETRFIASEDYEAEFNKLKDENQQAQDFNTANPTATQKTIMSSAEMIRKSTRAATGKSGKILKKGKKEREDYHKKSYLDALSSKYTQRYGAYFTNAIDELVALQSNKKMPDDPKIAYKLIIKAKENAIKAEHDFLMKDTEAASKVYQKEYNASHLTKAHKRKKARIAMQHAENMENEDYKQMYEAMQTKTMREKKRRRKAEKHMNRMRNGENDAYKEGFTQRMAKASGKNQKKSVLKARKAARTKAKLLNDERRNRAEYDKHGEDLTTAVQGAYSFKYRKSAVSKARRKAANRAEEIKGEQDHNSAMENDAMYKSAYESAIRAGSKPSDAREAAAKKKRQRDKAQATQAMYAGKAKNKAESVPGMEEEYAFYERKYQDDPKKAYKHAKAAARAIQKAKSKYRTFGPEIYDHPQFRETFAEIYTETGDEEKAMEEAARICQEMAQKDEERKSKGRFVAKDTERLSGKMVEGMQDWADSTMVKLVRKIKQIEKDNPEETAGLLDKIVASITGQNKARVDKKKKDGPTADELMEKGAELFNAGMEGFDTYSAGKAIYEEVTDSAEIPDGFQTTDFLGLAGPLISLLMMGKKIVEYIIDKKKGTATEESTEMLLMDVIGFIPNIQKTFNIVQSFITNVSLKATPIAGALYGTLEAFASLAVNGLKLLNATTGAKAIRKQMRKHEEELLSKENRDVFFLDRRFMGSTKIKVDRTLIRNALEREQKKPQADQDPKRIKALKQMHMDFEYERLYEKLIRDRSLDIAQNVVSMGGAIASYFPGAGTIASSVLTILDKGGSLIRKGVKGGKQLARNRAAANPMWFTSGVFDKDRSSASKQRDRAMFAVTIYDQLLNLPLPEDMPDDIMQRRSWLRTTIDQYNGMKAYTTMAMDVRAILNAESKQKILALLAGQMAASATHY